jgi:hypothetical protein
VSHCHRHSYLAYRIARNNARRIPPNSRFWRVFDVLIIWPLRFCAWGLVLTSVAFLADFTLWALGIA